MHKPTDCEYEERAAILEYDAGIPRLEAERLARAIVDAWRAKRSPAENRASWMCQYRQHKDRAQLQSQ